VSKAGVACFAHRGQVRVAVELDGRRAEALAVFETEEVSDGQIVVGSAQYAPAVIAVEDACLLGGSDRSAERPDRPRFGAGLDARRVVEEAVTVGASDGRLMSFGDELRVGGLALWARRA